MAGVLDSVNQRTQLVGQNRLELLLFRLDGNQLYGINVFKVKEVLQCPRLTVMPKSSPVVRGVANIRGGTIPILDLALATGRRGLQDLTNSFAIITEYNTKVQGFLVRSVERIVNMNWEEIHPPPKGAGREHYLTAVTRVDKQLVEIIDVEKVLAEVAPTSEEVSHGVVDAETQSRAVTKRVLVVDDSSVARKQVIRCLEAVGVEMTALNDGRQALEYLQNMLSEGRRPEDELLMLISDIEMPEMDGYTQRSALDNNVNTGDRLRSGRPGRRGLCVSAANADFELFRVFLEKTCGIVLGSNKQYLVSSRLNKLMEQQGIKSLGELVQRIQTQRGGLREMVVDAMTTNETLWFRDTYPFEVLKQRVLPELIKANGGQRLRIWSAACSSGQEPYSLSMAIDEFEKTNLGQLKAGVQIVATDLSGSMLTAAKAGEYDTLAMGRGLSPERLQRYFDAKGPGRWAVKPAIRSRVEFRALNLLDSYASLGKFDMVFCRNVLIYFSAEVKRDILLRIHGTLKPGGYLFLGASEALNNLPDHYQMVQCSPGIIYRAK